MERQDQNPIETSAPQKSEYPFECQEKNCTPKLYRSPQVSMVGKATRLMAGGWWGNHTDWLFYVYVK